MTTVAERRTVPVCIPPYPVYRFTVDQYHKMIDAGILTANDKVELLEGWIVPKMSRKPSPDTTLWLAQTTLLPLLPKGWILRIQSAITTADSEPEPDLAVAKGPGLRYYSAHPTPEDLELVIEVADTSVADDREHSGRIYARAKIPEYWILNIPEAQVEVYTSPKGGKVPAYRNREDYARPKSVPFRVAGDEVARVPVSDLIQ
jgi:Uma2 family endonuclease